MNEARQGSGAVPEADRESIAEFKRDHVMPARASVIKAWAQIHARSMRVSLTSDTAAAGTLESEDGMDVLGVIRHATRRAWDWLEHTVVCDVTEVQANWRPPGTANTIGATYAHVIVCADEDINRVMYGRPTLLESRWNGQAGLGRKYRFGEWNAFDQKVAVEWKFLRAYARDVHAWLLESLSSLTESDLQMPVDMSLSPGGSGLGQWKGIDIYFLHGCGHIYIHGGEIACLKGIQGQRGYVEKFRSDELFP